MSVSYPWYELLSNDNLHLQQGDIFRDYPIVSPKITPAHYESIKHGLRPDDIQFSTDTLDVVVLTQSCDLAQNKIDSVILCPLWSVNDAEATLGKNATDRRTRKETIRQGKDYGWHMLKEDDSVGMQLSIVEFKRIFTTPKSVLISFAQNAGSRVRLLPPYREHLSQAFARYFMRVGLPQDIPKFA